MRSEAWLLLILALIVYVVPVGAQTSRDTLRFGLEEAIEQSLQRSPEVAVSQAGVSFAAARERLAKSSRFLTDFNLQTAHAPAPGLSNPNNVPTDRLYLDPEVENEWDKLRIFNQVEVKITQPIYTWGQLGGSIKAAEYGTAVEEEAVREKELEVAYRTGEIYYNTLLAEALNSLTQEAGSIVNQAKTVISRLMDEGAEGVDDADFQQLLIIEQDFNRRVQEVTQRRLTAYAAFSRQLTLPTTAVAMADRVVLEPIDFALDSLDVYFAQALANRPELARAESGLAARDQLVRVARSDYYPKLFAAGSARLAGTPGRYRQPNAYIDDPLRGRGLQAGLGFRQQLNFAQTKARVDQAAAEREEVRYQMEGARQLILFETEEAYRNLIIARSAMQSQADALKIAREWLLSETINFDLELGDTENLVRAVQSRLTLEASYYETIQRYNVAVLRLQRATGVLVKNARLGTLVD